MEENPDGARLLAAHGCSLLIVAGFLVKVVLLLMIVLHIIIEADSSRAILVNLYMALKAACIA